MELVRLGVFLFFIADIGSLESKPTLPELLILKTSSGSSVNIVQEIGLKYLMLGVLLLNDDNGAVTEAITHQHNYDAVAINQAILTRWLLGQGKQPVTWSTLIGVLRDVGFSELAHVIMKELSSSVQSFGETVTAHFVSDGTLPSLHPHSLCIVPSRSPPVAAVKAPPVSIHPSEQRSGKVCTLYVCK